MTPPGFVTGLPVEAQLLRKALSGARTAAIRIACAGPGPLQAERAAGEILASGAAALISFGLAGGLDPALASGTVILPRNIVLPDGQLIAVDAGWHARLMAVLEGLRPAAPVSLFACDRPIASAAEKQEQFRALGAVAADMESGAIAAAARAAGVPFVVLRAICDPAQRPLPEAALAALGADGRVKIFGLIGALLRRPAELRLLAPLARDRRVALAQLGRVAALLALGIGA